jgi:hypothetical protein
MCQWVGHQRHFSPATEKPDASLHFLDQYLNLPTKIRAKTTGTDVCSRKQHFDPLIGVMLRCTEHSLSVRDSFMITRKEIKFIADPVPKHSYMET